MNRNKTKGQRSVHACFITEGGCNSTADRRKRRCTAAPRSSFVWVRHRGCAPQTNTCSNTKSRRFRADAHLQSQFKPLRVKSVWGFLFCFSPPSWIGVMRCDSRAGRLHSFIGLWLEEEGRPCWSQAACALHKIPLRKFRKGTGSHNCALKA